MGRPLYSSVILSRQNSTTSVHPVEHNEPPSHVPAVEKWSQWNVFDPDSDEFFQAEDAVYEDFLTEQQVAALEARQAEGPLASGARIAETVIETAGAANASAGVAEAVETGRLLTPAEDYYGDYLFNLTADRTSGEESRVADPSAPRITLAPPISPGSETTEGRSPSPDGLVLVSGLPHLSESPQPMRPLDPVLRPVSPIPDTPARVSGIFSSSHAVQTSLPPPVPQRQTQDGRDAYRYQFYELPYRISRLPGDQPALYRYPAVPSPLTS
jgi:hypothetical protein